MMMRMAAAGVLLAGSDRENCWCSAVVSWCRQLCYGACRGCPLCRNVVRSPTLFLLPLFVLLISAPSHYGAFCRESVAECITAADEWGAFLPRFQPPLQLRVSPVPRLDSSVFRRAKVVHVASLRERDEHKCALTTYRPIDSCLAQLTHSPRVGNRPTIFGRCASRLVVPRPPHRGRHLGPPHAFHKPHPQPRPRRLPRRAPTSA